MADEVEDCCGVTVMVGATAMRKTCPTPTSEEPPAREEEEEEEGRGEGAAG